MVKADVRDHGENRRQHIRAVQASAQAHFDDRDIHFLFYEIRKSERGHGLEKRRLYFIQKVFVLLDEISYFLFFDRCSVDADPLCQTH